MRVLNQDEFLAVKLAAADLLQAHKICSNIPPAQRTPFENDIAQMGRKRLERIATPTKPKGETDG